MPSSRFFLSLVFCLLSAAASVSVLAADQEGDSPKYILRYKFQSGETVRWKAVQQVAMRTNVSDHTQMTETVSTSTKAWRVKEVQPNGDATFEHVVEDVDMWQQLNGCAPVRYNSKTDKQPPHGFEDLAQSVNKPLSVLTLDPQGKIVHITRMPLKAAVATTNNTKDNQITIPLPPAPVAVGAIWTVPHDVDVPLPNGMNRRVKVEQRYSLEDVKTGVATIEIDTQILTPINDPALESQLLPWLSKGTVRFDIDAGRILSQQIDVDRHIVGFRGPTSSLHYVTRFTERYLPTETKVAQTADKEAKSPKEVQK